MLPCRALPHQVCSFAGSVLIAQPNFIFGDDAADAEAPNAWVGNFLAVLAGLCLAANFICARKAPEAPGLFSSVVVSAMGAVVGSVERGRSGGAAKLDPTDVMLGSLTFVAKSTALGLAPPKFGLGSAQLGPLPTPPLCFGGRPLALNLWPGTTLKAGGSNRRCYAWEFAVAPTAGFRVDGAPSDSRSLSRYF